ncbi:hypothetical protein LCGC14_1573350, partial [marine sediment metagenome]
VWSEKQDMFFINLNEFHLSNGTIIPFKRSVKEVISKKNKLNTMTDAQMTALIKSPFLKLTNTLNKITSIAQVYRMVKRAEELEKSEKILRVITARLSELQEQEYL